MKRINNYMKLKFVWLAALVVISLVYFSSGPFSLAEGPSDFIKTTFSPTVFSKTAIVGDETFYATIKSNGVCIKDVPKPSTANRFTFRYLANNKATGEQLVLNPSYVSTIDPFPQKVGDTYEKTNEVALQFPSRSQAGDYLILEEMTKVEMKDPVLGWQLAPEPTKPAPPVQPTAPTQPSAPTKPTAPTDASGSMDTKPTKPSEPTKPAEPTKPSEPTRPAEPSAPPGPRREIGTVTYAPTAMPEPAIFTPGSKPNLVSSPKPAPASNLTLSALNITPGSMVEGTSVVGTVTLNGPAPAGGQTVQLSTPDTTISFPASVTVKAGETSATFKITTRATQGNLRATIVAKVNNSQKYVVIGINPVVDPSAITVSPASITIGTSAVGTVTLKQTAPAGDQNVSLYVDSNLITIPGSVLVKAGETSVTFNISLSTYATYSLASPKKVTISAQTRNSAAKKTTTFMMNPLPPTVSSLTLSPDVSASGASSVGTVTLNGPAPAGGRVVQLSATPSTAVSLPASVVVKAGEMTATFNVLAKAVTPSLDVIISAKLNNTNKTAKLTLNPELAIAAFTVSPTTVESGASSVGVVTLNVPSTASDKAVQLSANPSASLTIPTSVAIKAGVTSVTFDIKSNSVASLTNVTISAKLNNSEKTAVLTINPTFVSCAGVCVPVGQSGPPSTMNQGTSGCKPAQISWYRCGWFSFSKCYYDTPQICYIAIPSSLSAVSVSQTSVVGGASLVGTVTLNNPAPQGGLAVRLSGPSAFLTIPPDITIPSGAISGTFNIGTKAVTSAVTVNVTATRDNFQRSADIKINPIPVLAVSALTISSASVTSGTSLVGIVTLNSAAPSGNQVVLLSSDARGILTLPASMIIKAGESSGTFNIQTKAVDSPVNATITAAFPNLLLVNNSYKTATLTINPTTAPCSYSCRPATRSGSSWVTQCAGNETAQSWSSCPQTTQSYRCGLWGLRRCSAKVDSICCKPK